MTMKTKKFNKKLSLNKKTIADLNEEEMKKAIGGVSGVDTTCLETMLITCGVQSCGTICFTLPNKACISCL